MTPNYGYGSTDWAAIANDPFWQYYQQNNLGFRSTQPSQNQVEQAYLRAMQEAAAEDTTKTQNIVPDYKEIKPESSGISAWVTGGLGAAVLLTGAAAITGHGNVSKGFKKIAEFVTGKAGNLKQKVTGTQGKLQNLVALRNADGSYTYFVPNKTKKYAQAEINNLAETYGIDLRALRRFKQGTTKLEGAVFNYNGKTITVKDGEIIAIKEGINDVTAKYLGDNVVLEGENQLFINNVNDIISNPKKIGKTWKEAVEEMTFKREIGDHIATVKYEKGKGRTITELATLEPLDKDSDAVRSWLQNHKTDKNIFTNEDFINKGIIPEGAKVEFAEIPYKGKVCRFENGEFKGVIIDNQYYAKGSEKCDSFLFEEESNLADFYKNFLKGKLPSGTNKREIKVKIMS